MSLFSKLSKNNDKTLYPWSQRKLGGSNSALPRAGHAAAAVSADGIVIYGGIHRTSTKKELFYIDTNSLSASSINASGDVPSPRISPVIIAMNGHIILYGGKPLSPEESYDGGFYFLNLHSRQWTRIQMEGNQPIERSGHSAVAHDGIMYIWGGQNEGNYFNDLFMFHFINNTPRWEQLSYNNECPEPRSGHISAIYENKLYIFGGADGHRLFNDIWSFDLHTGLWLRIEADGFTPSARESCASAMAEDVIYIIGGKGENGVELNDLCAYKIKSRRWFRFQNMGPSPSPRHGLTMTAVKERLFVLGGDNEVSKMDDSTSIYILDSTKIKYPSDTPQQQQPVESPNVQQQSYDTSSIEEMNGMSQQQYYHQQQQQQHQQQQQQYQQQQPYHQHQGGQAPLQQPQNQGQFSPQQQAGQKPFVDQRQPQRPNPPSSPVQQHQARSLVGAVMNANAVHKEIDTSMNYSDIQPSPSSSSSSPNSTSPRHRSYYPEGQSPTQPPVRPPRHISTVPEAALRRPRATSPLPQADTDIAADIRRQYQSNASPTSPTSIENEFLLPRSSPMQPSILAATEDQNFMVDPMLQQHQQQRMMHGQQQQQLRVSPNGSSAPPPRPPREGVGLGNNQRNNMAAPSPSPSETMNRVTSDQDEQIGPKSQMPPRNHSVPHPDYVNGLPPAIPPQQQQQPSPMLQHQQQQQQQQQPTSHNYAEPIPERSPSRQVGGSSPAGSSSPVHAHRKPQQPQQQDHAAATAAAVQAATAAATEERQTLLREIQARDVIISEMKKKEGWWRTEVSLARKLRAANKGDSFDEGPDADEALLMDIDHLAEDKVKLFEQLVSMKSELRRVRASILQQAQPMSEKVNQADRMRTAALQEAAYFKSKYLALKARRQDDLGTLDISRSDELEKRLAAALTENEANNKLLQQLQKRSQHDQTARHATEERAREAQARAEEAQQAHQRALEELESVYARATKAEVQVRENAVKIADLTQQLSEALMSQPTVKSQEVTEAQLKASQLEAANLKARNEAATLKQKLAENMDDIARLRTILNEREDALAEAKIHVEDYEIQLSMLREAMNQQQHQKSTSVNNTTNGFSPTRAY